MLEYGLYLASIVWLFKFMLFCSLAIDVNKVDMLQRLVPAGQSHNHGNTLMLSVLIGLRIKKPAWLIGP